MIVGLIPVFKDSRGEEKNDFNQNRMNANDDGTKS
jgi:hypothetical protein